MLRVVDGAIVVASIVLVVTLGMYASLAKPSATDGYFLAGRSMHWTVVAASLFAANFGSEQFIGMAGTAASSGIAIAIYELSAPYLLILLGWVFTPLYLRCNITTTPEYLEIRFNKICRLVFVSVLTVSHILASISSTIYAGAIVMEVVTGWTIWQSIPIVIVLTSLYTITGGLKAVMWTDALQTAILLTGGLVGSVSALNAVGGISGLFRKLKSANLNQFQHLKRPLNDRDFPWLGTWISVFIGGLRYWCLDQEMAQRVLSAKNLHHARLGTAGAALLKLLPLVITIFPGMVARSLFESCQADPSQFPDWCQTRLDDANAANKAYPLLVLHQFPHGIKGLMIASFLAAMMSSLASLFNSVASMITYDIYIRLFTHGRSITLNYFIFASEMPSPEGITRIGRIAVCGLVVVSFLWIPVIDASDRGLFLVAAEIFSHLGPSIAAVFVCGIFFRFVNEQGALMGLIVGSLLGALRLALYIAFQDTCDRHVHDHHQVIRKNL